MSGTQVRSLTEKVDMIFHANHYNPTSVRKGTRDLGNLRHLIRLSMACKSLRRLCLFSTTAVNRHPTDIVYEEELAEPKGDGTPSDTLRRAEQVIRELMPRLPCTVFRPSTIVGDSQTGESKVFTIALGGCYRASHSPSQMRYWCLKLGICHSMLCR